MILCAGMPLKEYSRQNLIEVLSVYVDRTVAKSR